MSHPAWVCGLKHDRTQTLDNLFAVTPCVGVWIETRFKITDMQQCCVTPCVGVWIETLSHSFVSL